GLDLYPPAGSPLPLRRPGEMADKPSFFQRGAERWASVPDGEWQEFRAYYDAMCSFVDFHCGRIVDCLQELCLLDETLVVFYSDHGEMAGDHGLVAKGPTNYESVVHVPCFMRWPGRIPAGRQAHGLLEAVDVMPTVLEAAGVAIPARVRGRSRWNLITGASEEGSHAVLIEHKVPEGPNI